MAHASWSDTLWRVSEPPEPLNPAVLERLREAMQGTGVDLVGELIELFLLEGPHTLRALRDAAGEGAAAPIAQRAHDLKGASANLGAERLVELCHQVERAARAEDLAAARGPLEDLEMEFERVCEALRALR